MYVNDGERLFNDGEMSIWSYTYFTIFNKHFIMNILLALVHPLFIWTSLERLHQLYYFQFNSKQLDVYQPNISQPLN